MSSERFYTLSFILISLLVVVCGYVNSIPPLFNKRGPKISIKDLEDSSLNFTELTGKYGYISDEHRVITEDGYMLTMFRIVSTKKCPGKKKSPPVLLMHGLLMSSDCFIDSGPSSGLAYLIADGCYDLWAGNCRGNYYSRSHLTLNPDRDPDYWQFDILQIGKYDLPAIIDYVLKYTRSKKLNYIGFSQGTGTFLVMCSERPEYCDKVQLLIGLAPASRHAYTRSVIPRLIAQFFANFENSLSKHGVTEIFANKFQKFIASLCQFSEVTLQICKEVLYLDGIDHIYTGSRTSETTRSLFGHFPAGTSLHNIARYGQSMNSKVFDKFDYGKEKNLKVYGSEIPPEYNLTAVKVPVVCIYGKNDGLVDSRDVKWLISKLPHVLEGVEVSDPLWTHFDVAYSQYTSVSIMPKINEYLSKYSWL